jgi:glyoxylase-like metal-dependent hydrolase (beta-lactamase superfamily II)
MKIFALEFYKNGRMKESFALGGTLKKEMIDSDKEYAASLQNYLIHTENEVILVDTGLPCETPEFQDKPELPLFMGEKVANFTDALKNIGYELKDVNKVILTHKHPDHSGELRLFNHAKIYISRKEAEAMNLHNENIVKVDFTDGPYKNFDKSQRISEHIYMIPAYGHTAGNSLVIVEGNGIYYMFHGDVTYTDEALRQNQLSVVFEDKELAKETLENVRTFIKENDTVYLGTHTPEALFSLKNTVVTRL